MDRGATNITAVYIRLCTLASGVRVSLSCLKFNQSTSYSISFAALCVCVFIKLHITTQSGPVILVILCHSH